MNWIDEIRQDISTIKSSSDEVKKFGVIVGGLLFLLSSAAVWKHWWNLNIALGIGLLGVSMLFLGICCPRFLQQPHRYWMCLAIIIGSIVSRIILFIIFFIILTPIALLAKMFRKQFLYLREKDKQTSYWIIRDQSAKINYERMS